MEETTMPIAKANLAVLGTPKTSSTRKTYPSLPEDDETKKLVTDYLDIEAKIESLEGAKKLTRSFLETKARAYYYEHYHGKVDVESSLEAQSLNGDSILLSFQNRYRAVPDETPIVDAIGQNLTDRFFYQSVDVKIDGDKIPADKVNDLFADLAAVMAKHGAADALSHKAVIKPSPEFHTARHTALSVEQNLAVDSTIPMVVAFKTKGRK
jgi:hypothetical protein